MSHPSQAPRSPSLPDTLLPRRFDWINATVITVTPLAAIFGVIFYIRFSGFEWVDLISFFIMVWITGLAITAGYHRYYSHRAYDCSRPMQLLLLIFGASAFQNSALQWVSDHRYHHQYTDRDEDPYNIKKGFFWAHMGWIYFSYASPPTLSNVGDLKKDPLIQWQHRHYVLIGLLAGLVVPFMIGLAFGRPWGGVIWGGLLRLVVVHHSTFLINSAAHVFGDKKHSDNISACDSWWLPFFSFGEGYHNYHHAYPSDYRNGAAWYHWDPTKWLIGALAVPGWTRNLRRARPPNGAGQRRSSTRVTA